MAAPTFFATPRAFGAWLAKHHATTGELLVGYYKKDSGKPSMTWPESVDEALCWGWIDGVRRSHGADAYTIRFTPRRPRSLWSTVNIGRVAELSKQGRMKQPGRDAFAHLEAGRASTYAYERKDAAAFDRDQAKTFRKNRAAWDYWEAQPPGYRRLLTHYVVSAKKPETRAKRLAKLIAHCAAGKRMI